VQYTAVKNDPQKTISTPLSAELLAESVSFVRCLLIDYSQPSDTINDPILFYKLQSLNLLLSITLWVCNFCRAMLLPSCGVHLSVCSSVTFVDHVKTNKHIEFFSPSSSHTILVFYTERGGDIPTGTPLTGASNAGGV